MKNLFRKRTIIVLLLALSLVFGAAFAGCSKSPADESSLSGNDGELSSSGDSTPQFDESITAYIYATEATREAWTLAIQDFENANGISVEATIGDDIADKLRSDILAGKIPDVVFLPSWEGSGVTEALIADNALADLSDLGLSGVSNSYCQPYGDGKTYIAPVGKTVYGVWYDASKVTAPPADLAALASYKPGDDSAVLAFAGKDADSLRGLFVSAVLANADAAAADKIFAGDSDIWDDANVKNALSALAGLSADGVILENSYEYSQGDVVLALANGEAAFGVLTNVDKAIAEDVELAKVASEGVTAEEVSSIQLKFLPLGDTAYAQLGDLYIPVEAKNIEGAKKFVSAIAAADMSALNGNSADAANVYCCRAADSLLERRIVNVLTSVLYGDTSADAFAAHIQDYIADAAASEASSEAADAE